MYNLKRTFACDVASFANSKGGMLIIGISDDREIIGVEQTTTRINQSKRFLDSCLDKSIDGIEILSVPIMRNNETQSIGDCLIIIIPQTKDVIGVKNDINGLSYRYPIRVNDGVEFKTYNEISVLKEGIVEDNYTYAQELVEFTYNLEN